MGPNELDVGVGTPPTNLKVSLDTVELVMEFEDEFDVNIPDEDAEKIQSVGDAIKYIQEHVS